MKRNPWLFYPLVLALAGALYVAYAYGYAAQKTANLPTAAEAPAHTVPAVYPWPQETLLFLHAVNTPLRAQRKEARFDGFEIDLMTLPGGQLAVAHDESDLGKQQRLDDIFSAMQRPAEKYYWLDLKTPLTQEHINNLLLSLSRFGIDPQQVLLETPVEGPNAELLRQNNLPLLLTLPEGFDDPSATSEQLAALQTQTRALSTRLQPAALAASFGKYAPISKWLPEQNKALYSTNIVRPSLIKHFLKKRVLKDPSVKIYLTEEYTLLPF